MNFVKQEEENLIFYPNRKRIAIASLITALTTVFFVCSIAVSFGHPDPRFVDYILGIFLALYFGCLTFDRWIYLVKNKSKPALTIDENGIWDNTLFSQIGAIAWQDIEEIFIYDLHLKSGGRERSLGIIPKTGREYLQQFPLSWHIRRIAIAAFFRFPTMQTPINILLRDLQLSDPLEFEREIRKRIDK